MKRKLILLDVVIFIFLCITFTQNVCGNPVYMDLPENPFITVPLLILMFFVGVRVESAYFNSKFFEKHNYTYISTSYFTLLLRINLVTFPLTQIFAYFFHIYFLHLFWFYVFLIEIGVVLIESFLLKIELKRVDNVVIQSKYIIIRTLFANITSFLVGLLAYLPVILL